MDNSSEDKKLLRNYYEGGEGDWYGPIMLFLAVAMLVLAIFGKPSTQLNEEHRLAAAKIASGGLWQVVKSETTGDSMTGWRFVLARNGYGKEDPMVYAVEYVNRTCPYYNEWIKLGSGEFIRLESTEPLKDTAYVPLGALNWLRPHSLTKPYSGGMIAGL
ncbi:MAG: hypothetical protein Q7K33_01760 [Candidatus Berkelbacteria bacterium]|nr:hypothetical protein [Candidatus Berkelbacteria bacterium]